VGTATYEFSDQQVLRVGLTGEYVLTPRLSGFGGIDYVSSGFDAGNLISSPTSAPATAGGLEEGLVNLHVGLRAKLSDQLTGECSINFTNSGSDFEARDYDRLRLSAGVSYSF
jgi:long-subunit fatty acid transport protein